MFGVHSAMSLREAYRRCPDGVFLPVDGRRYQPASRDVMAILRRYTPLVEPISIDEAFLDVTGSAALFGDGPAIARADQGRRPRRGRADRLGRRRDAPSSWPRSPRTCASPTGWSSCRPARRRRSSRRCRSGGCGASASKTGGVAGRLRRPDDRRPRRACRRTSSSAGSGSTARRWSSGPAGIDADPVHDGDPAKSVSHEHTFDVDTSDPRGHRADAARDGRRRRRPAALGRASGPARSRSRSATSAFRTITRQRTLAEPTDMTEPIYAAALELARPEIRGMPRPAARRQRVEPRRARAARRCSSATTRGAGGRSRRPTRSAVGTASGR